MGTSATVRLIQVSLYCRKTLHSRSKENRLVLQIQMALWRKLELNYNKKLYASKNCGQRKCSCISRGQILSTRDKNHSKSLCVPVSVKQTAKITIIFSVKMEINLPEHNLPNRGKTFIGTSSILAGDKSRVGLLRKRSIQCKEQQIRV